MTNWRIPIGGARMAQGGADTADTTGVTVTANATGGVKGAYSEIIASTAFDATWIHISTNSDNGSRMLFDVAIGGAGSEVIIIADLLHESEGSIAAGFGYLFPIFIPAGTRIAVRAQGAVGSIAMECAITYGNGGFGMPAPFSKVLTLGADTTNTGGTSLGDGGNWVAHTKKAYVEFTSSLALPIDAIIFALHSAGAPADNDRHLLDIAVGAASSEQDLLSNFMFVANSQGQMFPPVGGPIPFVVPAGARISARNQLSAARTPALGDRRLMIYGLVR